MAILQLILTEITSSISNILNTTFGWATMLLFGRVPRQKQAFVSVMALGAVVWVLVLVGVIFPRVAVFLSFLPVPQWVSPLWIRIAMFIAVIVVPGIVGYLSFVMIPSQRASGKGLFQDIVKGYPATMGIGLALIVLTVFAPIWKAFILGRRWTTEHLAVVINPRDYRQIVDDIQRVIAEDGLRVEQVPTNWMLRLPIRVLTTFSGSGIGDLVASNLTTLQSDRLSIIVYPSDIAINGKAADAAHAREIITLALCFSRAHLTWTAEAMKLEDRLKDAWHALASSTNADERTTVGERSRGIETDLGKSPISYREWDILFRDLLLVELALFESANRGLPPPRQLVRLPLERPGRQPRAQYRPPPQSRPA